MATSSYEQQLLRDAQDGDGDAYAELQQLLEPDLRRFVQRKIYDPYTVDDVLQETYIAFYRHFKRIDPVENLRPYVFRIARNKCYDALRKVQRRGDDVSLDDDPVRLRVSYTEAHRTPRPDDVTHWLLLHLEVEEAMANLADNQRETLLLYSEEGLSYAEIADVMECSIGTVKSRLYYAKKNLRGLLRPQMLAVLDSEFSNAPIPTGQAQPSATDDDHVTTNDEEENDHERPIHIS